GTNGHVTGRERGSEKTRSRRSSNASNPSPPTARYSTGESGRKVSTGPSSTRKGRVVLPASRRGASAALNRSSRTLTGGTRGPSGSCAPRGPRPAPPGTRCRRRPPCGRAPCRLRHWRGCVRGRRARPAWARRLVRALAAGERARLLAGAVGVAHVEDRLLGQV